MLKRPSMKDCSSDSSFRTERTNKATSVRYGKKFNVHTLQEYEGEWALVNWTEELRCILCEEYKTEKDIKFVALGTALTMDDKKRSKLRK